MRKDIKMSVEPIVKYFDLLRVGDITGGSVSPSAKIDVWRILVSSIPLVYDGNRFLRFLY